MLSESANSRLSVLVAVCAPVLGPGGDDPTSHLPIDGWREWRQVRESIERAARELRADRGAPLRLVRLHPPTLANLREVLRAGREIAAYPMVHLIGYASDDDGLLRMEQANGREEPVEPEELAAAFRGAGAQIVFLNICYGLDFANALIKVGVRAVVTTSDRISDSEAAWLAQKLYLGLALGHSIGEAYDFACESLIEAYRQRRLLPLDGRYRRDVDELYQYGWQRANNIAFFGDRDLRLTLPPSGEAAAGPDFDFNEPPHNLPHPDDVFVGRGRELAQIGDWMDDRRYRIIALTGIGGIGKSSLAVIAALRNNWRFSGVVHCAAKERAGPQAFTLDDLCSEVDTVLGLGGALRNIPAPKDRRQRMAELLNAHSYLLVLDNLETLSFDQTAELADFLQHLDPHSGTMALLTLRPEHFPPLLDQTRGNFHHLPVESLDTPDAVALLGELLQPPADREPTAEEWAVWSKAPTSSIAPGDRDGLESLAERAGVPAGKVAALEHLAAKAHHHPLLLGFAAADLKRPDSSWKGVLRRLQNLAESDLQRKVEDMIGEMCDDLAEREPEALTLLQSLLVFHGEATAEALRFVWCGKRLEGGSAEAESFDKACRAARHAALLSFTAGRYDLHPLVRHYLANHSRLGPRQRNQWAQAHAVFFLEYARRRQRDHDALEREQLNLFGAMDSAEQAGVDFMVVEFARCLFGFLWVKGFWSEGRERMDRGVAAARRLADRPSEAFLLHALGVLSVDCGEFAKARSCLEQSLEIKKTLSDETGKAVTLHELGFISRKQGDHEEAQRYLEESLALERASGHRLEQAWTLHQLGVLCKEQEKLAEARMRLEESLALFEQLDHKVGRAATSREFGDLCRDQGRFDEARRYYEESLPLFEAVRDQAGTLYKLARLTQAEGELDEAEELHSRSLAMAEKTGSPFWLAHNLYGLGQCAKARGEREEAERLFEGALAIAERLEIPLAERVREAMRN